MDLQIFRDLKSTDPTARAKLHQRLKSSLKDGSYFSVSHCPIASGFIIANSAVGLDLESIERIHRPLVARISSPSEMDLAPFFEALWVAKESAFKAVARQQNLKVISQIEVVRWTNSQNKFYFEIKNFVGLGYVEVQDNLILGIYQTPL